MPRVQNYTPPVKNRNEIVKVDTFYRPTHLPDAYYEYFVDTFAIPEYTCDNSTLAYPEISPTYKCYCSGNNYHQMPTIIYQFDDVKIQYSNPPDYYMLLPYIDYAHYDQTYCILAMSGMTTYLKSLDEEFTIFGQRFLANYPLLIFVDRASDTITASIGNGRHFEAFSNLKYVFLITASLILLMGVLIFYLVKLRTNRIKADQWLDNHKEEIISYALYRRTGDEIV